MQTLGVLGGTFSPVHNGHLHCAEDLLAGFNLDELRLIPCAIPAHRAMPELSAETRLTLLELATQNKPKLIVDDIELKAALKEQKGTNPGFDSRPESELKFNPKPSYTVDTLRQLRVLYGADVAIYFAMGTDAFEHFERWHQWQDILSLANIVVMQRPGYCLDALLKSPQKQWLQRPVNTQESIIKTAFGGHKQTSGAVYFQTFTQVDVSSTALREQIKQGVVPEGALPGAVERYISDRQLLTQLTKEPNGSIN